MSRETGFAIEIRERYQDVVGDRWPAAVDPQPDELLSTWLHRLERSAPAVSQSPEGMAFGEGNNLAAQGNVPQLDRVLCRFRQSQTRMNRDAKLLGQNSQEGRLSHPRGAVQHNDRLRSTKDRIDQPRSRTAPQCQFLMIRGSGKHRVLGVTRNGEERRRL